MALIPPIRTLVHKLKAEMNRGFEHGAIKKCKNLLLFCYEYEAFLALACFIMLAKNAIGVRMS